MQNFLQQLQTPLFQKEKTFSGFFFAFLKYGSNLDHFEKTDEYSGLIISEIIDSKRVCYINVEKVVFLHTIRKLTYQMVSKTAEISTAALLPNFTMNSR